MPRDDLERNLKAVASCLDVLLKLLQAFLAVVLFGVGIYVVCLAHESHTLVIEAFQVPPDFVSHNLDGTALAARLLDRLRVRIGETEKWSQRAADTIEGDWGKRDRIDVPQADTTTTSVISSLRSYFGGDVWLIGAVYRVKIQRHTGNGESALRPGIELDVRTADQDVGIYQKELSSDSDLDSKLDELIDLATYDILRLTQPYRYVIAKSVRDCDKYLPNEKLHDGCVQDSVKVVEEGGRDAAPRDRAWLYTKASERWMGIGEYERAKRDAQLASEADRRNPIALYDTAVTERALSHAEAALTAFNAAISLIDSCAPCGLSQNAVRDTPAYSRAYRADLLGSFAEGIFSLTGETRPNCAGYTKEHDTKDAIAMRVASGYAQMHDPDSASDCMTKYNQKIRKSDRTNSQSANSRPIASDNALIRDSAAPDCFVTRGQAVKMADVSDTDIQGARVGAAPWFFSFVDEEKWSCAVRDLEGAIQSKATERERARGAARDRFLGPWLAYAYAREGDFKKANAILEKLLSRDCYLCLEMRGKIADLEGSQARAISWFKLAATDAPSIPFAYNAWGETLLRHGDFDGAIFQFERAYRASTHYADAIELWGEALMAENRSDLALAKFEQAYQLAPNWAHLHLKWGEALGFLHEPKNALFQYRAALRVEPSQTDKSILDRQILAATEVRSARPK